jgi:hypothetical protein
VRRGSALDLHRRPDRLWRLINQDVRTSAAGLAGEAKREQRELLSHAHRTIDRRPSYRALP